MHEFFKSVKRGFYNGTVIRHLDHGAAFKVVFINHLVFGNRADVFDTGPAYHFEHLFRRLRLGLVDDETASFHADIEAPGEFVYPYRRLQPPSGRVCNNQQTSMFLVVSRLICSMPASLSITIYG